MSTLQDTIIIEPTSPAKRAVIWLHGLGADANDFVPLAQTLQQQQSADALPMRFVFPNAPRRPVTLNHGYVMRAWYDITGLTLEAREDREGLNKTAEVIDQLIQAQIQSGIAAEHIYLGGFSQGAAAILYAGLRYSQKLAGLIALSGYLPLGKNLNTEKSAANQDIPIFLAHGTQDTTVPLSWAEISKQQLQAAGFKNLDFYTYPMGHYVCETEIETLGGWLQ